jgi:hypothetical protein
VFFRPYGSLLRSLEAWDKIVSVSTHRVRGGRSGLVTFSLVVARVTGVTGVCGVVLGPAVTAGAFDRSRGVMAEMLEADAAVDADDRDTWSRDFARASSLVARAD